MSVIVIFEVHFGHLFTTRRAFESRLTLLVFGHSAGVVVKYF